MSFNFIKLKNPALKVKKHIRSCESEPLKKLGTIKIGEDRKRKYALIRLYRKFNTKVFTYSIAKLSNLCLYCFPVVKILVTMLSDNLCTVLPKNNCASEK